MRRDERVTVQGPVKEQQPDGLSHGGGGWLTENAVCEPPHEVPRTTNTQSAVPWPTGCEGIRKFGVSLMSLSQQQRTECLPQPQT